MRSILAAVFATLLPLAAHAQLPPPSPSKVDYDEDVKPLLAQHCYSCHGERMQQSGLRLDRRQPALRGGDYGPVITPGKSAESKLIKRLVDGDGGLQMPPTGSLTSEEIGVLRAWIDQGADFRNDVADEAPPRPIDAKLAALIAAVRAHDQAAVEKAINAGAALVKAADPFGSTPLHHAAAFGSIATITWLLDHGADINARNRRASTALHWAIHDEARVRLLLARGADVNAKQNDGATALLQASRLGNAVPMVHLLLDHGADPNVALLNGLTPLMAAAIRGDAESLRLLLDRKANVNAKNGAGETALLFAASDGNPRAVRLLLERGADATVRTKRNESALGNAATSGSEETVRMLLDRGAEVNVRNIRGFTPLMLAASSETAPAGVVRMLLANGADTTLTADYDETARDLAAKRGDTEVTRLLGGLKTAPRPMAVPHSAARPLIPQAIERALRLLEKQSHNFIRIGGCNSCHSQDLPSAAAALARSRGIAAPREIPQLPASMLPPPERLVELNIVAVTGIAWELFDFALNRVPANSYTDAAVRMIIALQTPDGSWNTNESRRPPMSSGPFQAAALSIYALKTYGRAADNEATERTIAKAIGWLIDGPRPETTQDRAFQALGLAWAGSDAAKDAARALIAMQRSDGGWSQLAGTLSDAYATGQVLYALHTAGKMPVGDPVYKKGVNFLRRTQAEDGSWHVRSRSIWVQPYFESGFPYGQDQFISAAGTAWASMALSLTVEPPAITTQAR